MTIVNWTTNASGDWNTGSLWSGGVVPNSGSVDVTIDASTTLATYTVTIAAGETQTVDSLTLNAVNNFGRAQYPYSYVAAELELDGTLIFAAGGSGALGGAPQSYIHVAAHKNAAILNGGDTERVLPGRGQPAAERDQRRLYQQRNSGAGRHGDDQRADCRNRRLDAV